MSRFSLSMLLPMALVCLILRAQLIAGQTPVFNTPNQSLISKACDQANHKDFCINLLRSDRNSPKADLRGLAYIALRVAEKNASATASFIKQSLYGTESDTDLQALMDCSDHYLTAVELIEDSISALVSNVYNDVAQLAKAAVADLDACDASVKQQGGTNSNAVVLMGNKNLEIRQLINTALSIAHVASSPTTTTPHA